MPCCGVVSMCPGRRFWAECASEEKEYFPRCTGLGIWSEVACEMQLIEPVQIAQPLKNLGE